MDHHRQLVDAVDVDAQVERSSVLVSCHVDAEAQGQEMEGRRRHTDRVLKTGPNVELSG